MEVYPSSNRKYCSRKCAAARQTLEMEASKVSFTCEQCGKEFFRTAREIKNKAKKGESIRFCCRKCKDVYWGRNRVKITCCVCGKTFLVQKKDAYEHKTCSPECAKHNVHNRREFNKGTVELVCSVCGKRFTHRKSYVDKAAKRGQPIKYCSVECQRIGSHHSKVSRVSVHCKNCNAEFFIKPSEKRQFCSQECRLQFVTKDTKILTCQHCGIEFKVTRYQINHGRKYCSRRCRNEAIKIQKDNYATFQHYIRTSTEYERWRLAVLQNANYRCSDCGTAGVLHAHHKIELYNIAKQYNFDIKAVLESPEFNDVSNGECLCVQCHIKRHPYHKELRNCKGQFCRREFNPTNQIHDD